MGKKNGNKRKRKDTQQGLVTAKKIVTHSNERQQQFTSKKIAAVSLPPPFPTHVALPKKAFLRNDDPSVKEIFQLALDTAYEGVAYDIPPPNASKNVKSHFDDSQIQNALETLNKYHWFRTDITQPYGLGTPCAKTYVTRCLLGEPGTTYKYLGLRMFAHSWTDEVMEENTKSVDTSSNDLKQAVSTILQMNEQLTHRTQLHLNDLERKRLERMGNSNNKEAIVIKGRAKFDITLINRMIDTPELKREPTTGEGRCAVSWHADSTLEHYSTIAVYQTILKKTPTAPQSSHNHSQDNHNRWSLALRVAHHSEGPSAGSIAISNDSRKKDESDTPCPNLALSLPSGSAYYLLDDFNHHHQHAVLVNDTQQNNNKKKKDDDAGVRYASTHRLLREGHNVHHIMERCKNAVSQFHKKGVKIWRSEQLLLNELESEWIRQFYIQGEGHKTNLWKCWKKPILILLEYWSKLETRTKQTIELLLLAAEARCGSHQSHDTAGNTTPETLKSHKKLNEKRKKALASMEDMIQRGHNGNGNASPKASLATLIEPFYDTMIQSLEERSTMRQLWLDREADPVFHRMDHEYHPLSVPLTFEYNDTLVTQGVTPFNEELGKSPLVGSPQGLKSICRDLEEARAAYISGK